MATLGDTSEPTASAEAWSGSNYSMHAHVLTMPSGGPWLIQTVSSWVAGYGTNTPFRHVVWDGSSGAVIGYSTADLTAIQRTFSASGSDLYTSNVYADGPGLTPLVVSGGSVVIVGVQRQEASYGMFFGKRSTGSHRDKIAASYLDDMASNTTHSTGAMGVYLTYIASNTAPNAPTLNDPTGGELVSSTTPTLNFTPSDPDGDAHTGYTYQVDDNPDCSSPFESTEVNGSFTNGVAINRVVTTTLSRGTTYYWRVKTKDATNGYGPYSAIQSFKVAQLPTATLTAPANNQPAKLYFNAGASGSPKIRAEWTYNCPDGHAQNRAVVRIYADGGALQTTETYDGSNPYLDTAFTVVEGTKYDVTVQVRCSLNLEGTETAKNKCRTRWARGIYYFDSGSTPLTLGVATDVVASGNQVVVIDYGTGATGAPPAEPSTWYSSVAAAGLNRVFWHRVTMFAWGASPTSPTIRSVTWTYSNNALILDHWNMASGAVVDVGVFVYGEQSLKHVCNGAEQNSYQLFNVTQDTDIVMSGKVKIQGDPNAQMLIMDSGGTVVLASVDCDPPSPTDQFVRYSTPVINTGAASQLRAVLRTNAAAGGNTAWFEIQKIEASTVVTPWNPGFLGALKVDAGGMIVDAQRGAIFRLKGSTGGERDIIQLGANGLDFGGNTSPVSLYSPSADLLEVSDDLKVAGGDLTIGSDVVLSRDATESLRFQDTGGLALNNIDFGGAKIQWGSGTFPSSPVQDDLFYRTDRDLLYFYDGTRWLSSAPFILPFQAQTLPPYTGDAVGVNRMGNPGALYGASSIWLESFYGSSTQAAAGSGSQYWNIHLMRTDSSGTRTTVATINTQGNTTGGRWYVHTPNVVNAVLTTDQARDFEVDVDAVVGSPGNLHAFMGIVVRIIG